MAIQEVKFDPPSESEVAITLFCWFETIATAPHIFSIIIKPFPALGNFLSQYPPYSIIPDRDFWVTVIFGLCSMWWVLSFLSRRKKSISDHAYAQASASKRAEMRYDKNIKRLRLIRNIRSLGLVWIREKFMDVQKITFYETFRRPVYWEQDSNYKLWIDRIYIDGLGSKEFQYSRDYRSIKVRKTTPPSSNYLEAENRPPTTEDVRMLLVASSYFPFWYFRFIIRKFLDMLNFS